MIWGYLLHLGVNMWSDRPVPLAGVDPVPGVTHAVSDVICDKGLWLELTTRMAEAGFNMVVIDLGEGIRYATHPELGLPGAWSPAELREELDRLHGLGLEPIPKLNFSAAHDTWLGDYGRQLSTAAYYRVVADLIGEVAELFERPRFFHIGMDEETDKHQQRFLFSAVRRGDLWWHDLDFLVNEVTQAGSRAWAWSDAAWHHPDEFYRRMPRSVVQSNWYYQLAFDADESNRPRVLAEAEGYLAYLDLDEHRYDQVPTGSTWDGAWANLQMTADFCGRRLDPSRLLGYLQAPWVMTTADYRDVHLRAIAETREVIQRIEAQR